MCVRDCRRPFASRGRCGGEPLLLEAGGDLERSVCARIDSLRTAMPASPPSLKPGKPSDDSWRYMGVAYGSMETAERMGKTRSIEPGLSAAEGSLLEHDDGEGEAGRSFFPVNMETDVSRGVKGVAVGAVDLSPGVVATDGRLGTPELAPANIEAGVCSVPGGRRAIEAVVGRDSGELSPEPMMGET